jgi:hypothetical protein
MLILTLTLHKHYNFYTVKSCIQFTDSTQHTIASCLEGIKSARRRTKQEIQTQTNAKEQYQFVLASHIIDRKLRHLTTSDYLSDKLQHEDLNDRKLKHMSEATARGNLFTMLKFDIQGLMNPYSIKHNALTRVDATIGGCITPLIIKDEIEDHLLRHNPQAYCASGTTPFGHNALGRALGPTGNSPLTESILDGSFTYPDLAI